MTALYQTVISNDTYLLYLGLFSLTFFIVTLIVIPWLILRIPSDYFAEDKRHSLLLELHHPVLRVIFLLLKNIAGAFFLVLGIALLVLPGQGLLTMLIGTIMIDFPGKYHLQRWFIQRKSVLKSINWLRKKGKRAPIVF